MTISTNVTYPGSKDVARQVAATKVRIMACYPVKRPKIDRLNSAVFHRLYKSGASRDLICSKFAITCDEFKQMEFMMAM